MLKNKQRMILKMSMLTVMFNSKGMERGPNEFDRTMDTTSNELHTSMDISMEQENKVNLSVANQAFETINKYYNIYIENANKLFEKIEESGNTVRSSHINLQEIEDLFKESNTILELINDEKKLLEKEKDKIKKQLNVSEISKVFYRDDNKVFSDNKLNIRVSISKEEALKFDEDLKERMESILVQKKEVESSLEQLKGIKYHWLIDRFNFLFANISSNVVPEERNTFFENLKMFNFLLSDNLVVQKNGISQLCHKYFINHTNVKEEEKQMVMECLNVVNQLKTYESIID